MSFEPDARRPPDEGVACATLNGGLSVSLAAPAMPQTLGALPTGARLILRCRKDWRDATISAVNAEAVTLSVNAPSGRTYRVRRPPDAVLSFESAFPVLGEGSWRAGFARYDARW
ncbi:MAG TPA: hypothetical protein VGC89_01630 [Pyrinomonadaceae bacterium]